MIGTFYWWDPFAAFLLTGTVIGLSFWLRRTGPVALFGLVGCMLGTIGLVYSTSRADRRLLCRRLRRRLCRHMPSAVASPGCAAC